MDTLTLINLINGSYDWQYNIADSIYLVTGGKYFSCISDWDFCEPDQYKERSSYMRGVRQLSCMMSV